MQRGAIACWLPVIAAATLAGVGIHKLAFGMGWMLQPEFVPGGGGIEMSRSLVVTDIGLFSLGVCFTLLGLLGALCGRSVARQLLSSARATV